MPITIDGNGTIGGASTLSTTVASPTFTTPNINSAQIATVTGTAPLYAARAWVNFNGTGTVAIRASGNVSSITDNGTGDYTVNFTTTMPDANYATHINVKELDNTNATTLQGQFMGQTVANTFGTTFARVATFGVGGSRFDCVVVNVTVFR